MAKKPSEVDRRIAELSAEIAAFDRMSDAGRPEDLNGRVGALKNAAALRKQLASIYAEREASACRDPVRRLVLLHRQAAADGSWVAAAQIQNQVEAARAKAAADKVRKAEEAKRDPDSIIAANVNAIKRMPDAMAERLVGAILGALSMSMRRKVLAPFIAGLAVDDRRATRADG